MYLQHKMLAARCGKVFVRNKRKCLLLPLVIFVLYLVSAAKEGVTCEGPCNMMKKTIRGEVNGDLFNGNRESGEIYCAMPLQRRHNIQCDRLINGDVSYTKALSHLALPLSTTCNLTSVLSDCRTFRIRHGYDSKLSSKEELDFPIAFGIKVHRDPIQVEQLLRTIYRPHNVYCIHVDLKADDYVSDPLRTLAKCFDNVFVIKKYRVIYSSIRQPLSDIACMEKVRNRDWKYYIILAGQEFVLKTNLEIVNILKILNGTNDIESYPLSKRLHKRVTKRHYLNDTSGIIQKTNITKTPFKHNITLHKGSSYGMLSRAFVDFILDSTISQELFAWATDTYAPEEMVWSTLNALPDAPGGFKKRVEHSKRTFLSRAMIWKWDKVKCNGQYIRSVCVFSHMDLPWLVSTPEVVANKFSSEYDQLAIDCLEEWINNKTALGTTLFMNWFYFRNVPHVKENNMHKKQEKNITLYRA